MQFLSHALRRSIAAAGAAVLMGSLIAGCSGGGATTALPSTQSAHQTGPSAAAHVIATINVSRSAALSVAAKVKKAGAWAVPMRGRRLNRAGMHPQSTAGAGNDLSNSGGPVMAGATNYNILVNSSDESPWGGMIGQFENDLYSSNMIGAILNQYVGSGSFTNGGDVTVNYDTSNQLGDQDIYNIVYQVAKQYGVGYNNIYHVFLDSTVSQCSQNAGGCYGQDYCAYHGNTDYSDIGHVIYSVEPYQGIQGCEISDTNSPNGQLADSTASTLSHESFEAYTDPDVPNNVAWYNQNAGEIGDICAPANGVNPGVVQLGSDNWEIQPEYSNSISDCSYDGQNPAY